MSRVSGSHQWRERCLSCDAKASRNRFFSYIAHFESSSFPLADLQTVLPEHRRALQRRRAPPVRSGLRLSGWVDRTQPLPVHVFLVRLPVMSASAAAADQQISCLISCGLWIAMRQSCGWHLSLLARSTFHWDSLTISGTLARWYCRE